MTRTLASIRKIVSLDPIPDADRIEKATVDGWEVVVAKSENHRVGDLVCYIEVDSIVPDRPEFEFLRDRKFRVRTIKLKKQISQGLILPLSVLPKNNWKEGDDVTFILGIRKYDPEGEKEQKLLDEKAARSKNRINKFLLQYPWYRRIFSAFMPKKGGWPKFIAKTDEERIQNMPSILEKGKDKVYSVTEKLDGQSATYFLVKNKRKFLWFGKDYIFGVCSRNLHLPKEDHSSYWTIAKQCNIENALKDMIGDSEFIVLQGEILGEGIQKNKYKITGYDFYAFNLIYPDVKVPSFLAKDFLSRLNIKFVPILDNNFLLLETVPDMVNYAKGKSTIANIKREGVVIRDSDGTSFKVINAEFLLEWEE
jgi:hypothetical protein